MPLSPLPVDAYVDEIRGQLARHRAVVLSAAPGAGKTTRVAPALVDGGRVILLQPRRVAARAVTRRIAEEQQWTAGREVGWHIRFERQFTRDTRLLVVTEGILTARLQQDPLLSEFTTVILDEFHERSVHADIGIALARQAWLARDDLRLVVMSATLDVDRVRTFLGGCPHVEVPGRLYPLTVEYAPGERVADAVGSILPRAAGQILCFLPGVREIERARADLAPSGASGVEVVALHGSLGGEAQDAAIAAASGRRVILATNVAETSLTVPGVTAVIDSGLVKVARHDPARGVDGLTVERVTLDSAEQRAGRAARLGPGLVRRLWDARDRLRPHREPEIHRVDLAGPILDLLAWGATLDRFEWFEAPPAERISAAVALLRRLGAIDGSDAGVRLTATGRQLHRVPLHPRLARILLDARGAPEAAAVCALLSEPLAHPAEPGVSTTCDLLPLIDRFDRQPAHVRRVAEELRRVAASTLAAAPLRRIGEAELRHALWVGYADRLAKRRGSGSDRLLMASGHGATLGRESGVRDGEFLVALDVVAAARDNVAEARIRTASRVEREWIAPTTVDTEYVVGADGRVKAIRHERVDAVVVASMPVAPDPDVAAARRRDAWLQRPRDAATMQLLRRARFAGVECDLPALALRAAAASGTFAGMVIADQLEYAARRALDERAPATLAVPSGRAARLDYQEDGSVAASVKLQELFGLLDTPTIGERRVPVTLHLLAPNGRPVQTTRDLRSFWDRTYPEVRKELRGRYPKHPWPEDPRSAPPTHRATARR